MQMLGKWQAQIHFLRGKNMRIETRDPATGDIIRVYRTMTWEEASDIIAAVQTDYLHWRDQSMSERAIKMRKAAELLNKNNDTYAKIITMEMGKPIKLAREEIKKCAWVCEYFAEQAEAYLAPQV